MTAYTVAVDILFYGNTQAAINGARLAAKRLRKYGARVALVTDRNRLGGMSSNALIAYDAGRRVLKQDPGDEDTRDIAGWATMGNGETGAMWYDQAAAWGSKDRRGRFQAPLTEYLIQQRFLRSGAWAYFGMVLTAVNKTAARTDSITCTKGNDTWTFTASHFADCTIEGDLMAMAGIEWVIGRDNRFEESLGGWTGRMSELPISPYISPGVLAPGVTEFPNLSPGDEDDGMQSLGIRFEIGRVADGNAWAFYKPVNYDEAQMDIWIKRLLARPTETFKEGAASGYVYDLNNFDGLPGWSRRWTLATPAERGIGHEVDNKWDWTWTEANPATILSEMYTMTLGMLWYRRNKGSAAMRDSMKPYGLTKLGYPERRGVAAEIYLRSGGRRLRQSHDGLVMTQHHLQNRIGPMSRLTQDSCLIVTLKCDIHEVKWHPKSATSMWVDTGVAGVSALVPYGDGPLARIADGTMVLTTGIFGCEVPMRAIKPPEAQSTNILCVMPYAGTHMFQASARCEKDYGNLGEASGYIMSECVINGWTQLDAIYNHYADIQALMRAGGMVIDIPR